MTLTFTDSKITLVGEMGSDANHKDADQAAKGQAVAAKSLVPTLLTETRSSQEMVELEAAYSAHNYHPLPAVFTRAEGVHVWDPEGKRYYDFLSAYSAVNQGHAHPKLIQTLVYQAQRVALSSRAFYNDVFGKYAKFVTEYFGFESVLPMNTGAEAVETALKLARKWAYEKKGVPDNEAIILSCENNFHGRTIAIIGMSSDGDTRGHFGPFVPGIASVCPSSGKALRFNHPEDLEAALEAHGKKVAAFLVEPIQGEAGVFVPDEGYLAKCYALCKKHNVLFIADEIQTGLARTGKLLACDHENVKPDLLILGKALSGGMYPVSAVLTSKEVMDCIHPGQHGSTFGGNPLGSALAIAALEILRDEKMAENSARLGEKFRKAIRDLNSPLISSVRGKGLLNAVDIDPTKCGRNAWELCLLLKERGLLAKPTHQHTIRLAPPLCITEAQLDECTAIFIKAVQDIVHMRREDIPGAVSEASH